MLTLSQRLSQQQKLSPQQIQYQKLLQLNTLALEQRIKTELEINPILEEEMELEQEDKDKEKDDEFEMKMYNKWLIKEIKRDDSFKLYTNKYGDIETIMNYKPY